MRKKTDIMMVNPVKETTTTPQTIVDSVKKTIVVSFLAPSAAQGNRKCINDICSSRPPNAIIDEHPGISAVKSRCLNDCGHFVNDDNVQGWMLKPAVKCESRVDVLCRISMSRPS